MSLSTISGKSNMSWKCRMQKRQRKRKITTLFLTFDFLSLVLKCVLYVCMVGYGWMNECSHSTPLSSLAQWEGGLATRDWRTEKHLHQRGPKAVYTWFTSGQTCLQNNVSVGLPLCSLLNASLWWYSSVPIACCGLYYTVYSIIAVKAV